MSTGQIMLSLGAIVLFSYTAININRTYVSSVKEQVQIQRETEIVSYGESLAELLYSYSSGEDLNQLYNMYGDCTEVNNSCQELVYETNLGFTLYATVSLEDSAVPGTGIDLTIATIKIFDQDEETGDFFERAEFKAGITPLDS